jgi:ankyrin repeat protein
VSTRCIVGLLAVSFLTISLRSQNSSKVDFGRDIQPILRERCYGCHGSSQQIQGLRLDRRRIAIPNRVGANRASIVPGNSEASPVYLKLIGKQGGLQMPPDGALSAEQIGLIKRWIDEGADWPDPLAGEAQPSIPDPQTVEIMEAIRNSNRQLFLRMLNEHPGIWNRKGKGGSTPLMFAALYGDGELLRILLDRGADPNIRNDASATALMYATDGVEKTRLLLEHGADPNIKSEDGQTALSIAAWRPGSSSVMMLLLDHGASVSLRAPGGGAAFTALNIAAIAGDEDVIQLLLDRGIDKTQLPLGAVMRSGCGPCTDILMKYADTNAMSAALAPSVAGGDIGRMRLLLERGARPGSDVLPSLALSPQTFPTDFVEALIRAGADVNGRTGMGGAVLDLARLQGDTPLVRVLLKSGARESSALDEPMHQAKPARSVRAAIERSLPLLDRADIAFIEKAGCISCHNNTLTPTARAAVRKARIPVNEQVASSQLKKIVEILAGNRDRALQALGLPGRGDTAGYVLMGLAAANYPPDEITDAWARYLKNLQQRDGRWRVQALRPPLESSDIQGTAAAIRALQIYAPKSKRDEYRKAVQSAARWLEAAQPLTNEDRAFLLLGLHWADGNPQAIQRVARDLLSQQRSDGGWAQLSTLPSDAYATGQALVALGESGSVKAASPAYQRGVSFLLNTQMEDGSWFVRTRTLPVQPPFDSDFPHGRNQFISAAATNWATTALALASPSTR